MKAHFERGSKQDARRPSGPGKTTAALPKTALLWGLAPDSPALSPLRAAGRLGLTLRAVAPRELNATVAALCGIPDAAGNIAGLSRNAGSGRNGSGVAGPAARSPVSAPGPAVPIPAGPALVLCGLPEPERDALLEALRDAGAVIPLKAIVTPANQGWTFAALLAELAREHAALQNGTE